MGLKHLTWLWLLCVAGCAVPPTRETATAVPEDSVRVEGALTLRGVPQIDPQLRERFFPYQDVRPNQLLAWMPGGAGLLIATRSGQTTQLHGLGAPEAAARQLTFFEQAIERAASSFDERVNGFIFERGKTGSDEVQLYFQSYGAEPARALTLGRQRVADALFARSGGRYAYSSNARNGQDRDVWLGDVLTDAAPRRLTAEPGSWVPLDFSADGQRLLVRKDLSRLDQQLFELDLATQALSPLLPGTQPGRYAKARYAHDGLGVYYLSDLGGDVVGLHHLDRRSGNSSPITPFLATEVEDFALGYRDEHVALLDNTAGSNRLLLFHNTERGKVLPRPFANIALSGGVIEQLQFSEFGTDLAFVLDGPQVPRDVLSVNLATKQLSRWTRNVIGGIDPQTLDEPTAEHAGGFDIAAFKLPRQIPGWYYRPRTDRLVPVVILLGDGPSTQARPRFDPLVAFLVRELQVAVITPNVRGSAGQGRNYEQLDDGSKRLDAVRDVESWVDWARAQPELDGRRVAIVAEGYGGFLVLHAAQGIAHKLAGIAVHGAWRAPLALLEQSPPDAQPTLRAEWGDERDSATRESLRSMAAPELPATIALPQLWIRAVSDRIAAELPPSGPSVWTVQVAGPGTLERAEQREPLRLVLLTWLQTVLKLQNGVADPAML